MKTNVQPTSINTWNKPETKELASTQLDQVAAYVVAQTKAGKPQCITSIWEYFSKQSSNGLGQTGTVSRVCNTLAKPETVIVVDGREYIYQETAPKKHGRNVVKHFCLVLKTAPVGEQTELLL